MKSFARAFVAGFGFVVGASIGGALLGYGIGKVAELQLKKMGQHGISDDVLPEVNNPSDDIPREGDIVDRAYDAGYNAGVKDASE